MALMSRGTYTRLELPRVHMVDLQVPANLRYLRRQVDLVRRLQGQLESGRPESLRASERATEELAELVWSTIRPDSRDDSQRSRFTGTAAYGHELGLFGRQRPDYRPGFVEPHLQTMLMQLRATVGSVVAERYGHGAEGLAQQAVYVWCVDAGFYVAQTGTPAAALRPAFFAELAAGLIGLFGPSVDVRHLQP